jgi:putative transposase
VRTSEGWLYLAIVLDLFSRMVVGWFTSSRIGKELVMEALQRALKARNPKKGLDCPF